MLPSELNSQRRPGTGSSLMLIYMSLIYLQIHSNGEVLIHKRSFPWVQNTVTAAIGSPADAEQSPEISELNIAPGRPESGEAVGRSRRTRRFAPLGI